MNMHGATVANGGLQEGIAGQTSLSESIATAIEVRIGRGMEALLALQGDWATIAATQPDACFHHSYAWHLSYLRNLEQDASSVHFFSFFRNGRPVAIFPLRRSRRRAVTGTPFLWVWELPFHPHMNLCDCIIAHHEDGAALLRLLVDTLGRRKYMPWDALHLPNLLDDAQVLCALRSGVLSRTLLVRASESMYFRCDDIGSAMCNCTKKFKRNLRRQRNKLDQLGRVEVSLVQDRTALDQAFAAFAQLEASGWKGGSGRGSAILLHPNLRMFYQDLMQHFAADQRCLISLLKLDGIVIAAQFCVIAGRTLYLLKTTYDETLGPVGPGNQLLHEVLRYCCESKLLVRLSLVTGPAWAVGRWNPDVHQLWKAYVFNSSPRGISAYVAARLRPAVGVVARARSRLCAGGGGDGQVRFSG